MVLVGRQITGDVARRDIQRPDDRNEGMREAGGVERRALVACLPLVQRGLRLRLPAL